MKHVYHLEDVQLTQESAVTIGVFDGVHIGHQTLIKQFVAEAHQQQRQAAVITFFPHPDVVLNQNIDRYYLTTPDYRAQLMHELGVDIVITHPFNEAIRQQRAMVFVEKLRHHLKMKSLWVGADFALGYKREGDISFLREAGKSHDFTVTAMDLVGINSGTPPVSSSLIREYLLQGDVSAVQPLLNRPYSVKGRVVSGFQRGRTIGFPTANIDVWAHQLIPRHGVYAGRASFGGETFMAVTNIGVRPTFDGDGITVEAHLLDFDRDIYGVEVYLTLEKFLRSEVKFAGLDALKAQLKKDVDASRSFLGH